MEQEIYRVSEFCRKYAISKTAFYRELVADRLHVIKRGRRTLIVRSEAERWFNCQAQSQSKHVYRIAD